MIVRIPVSGTNTASYLYDATGSKLKSVQGTNTREYINGAQYTNGVLDFVQTDEGLAVRNAGTGLYAYEYNLKDNLGNVRVTIDANGGVARVIQEDEYYAFGLDKSLYRLGTENKYLYNGKEKQELTLTDEYDYGARFYDPVVGRWTTVDPLVENGQENTSPYGYVFDDPVKNVDPDGKVPEEANGCCGIRQAIVNIVAVATALPRAILPESFQRSAVKVADRVADGAGFPTLNDAVDVLNGKASADDQKVFTGKMLAGVQGMLLSGEMEGGASIHVERPAIEIDPANKIDRSLLNAPEKHGNAPTFKTDGESVDIHHVGQNAKGPFEERHPSNHRKGGSYKENHAPGKKGLTKAERKAFDKAKTQYWKKEYPKE